MADEQKRSSSEQTNQPENNMEDQKKHKEYVIVVNGEQKTVSKQELTFVEVLNEAFPPPRQIPDKDYSITFKDAASEPHQGQLHLGGKVEVKDGTRFDVTPTNKS
ncbi:MAG TPA: multiubiquitin domain-containing protein [Bacteroidota bacterium]|nr:multiubiquitin domain-containing protein [Bacteroidota bacterium]